MGKITKIEGGVTAAKGFFSASCMAQIKYTDRLDMAMVYSNSPCVSAGTYTTNLVKAAPVVWDRKITDGDGMVQAIVVNAGIANAVQEKKDLTIASRQPMRQPVCLALSQKKSWLPLRV